MERAYARSFAPFDWQSKEITGIYCFSCDSTILWPRTMSTAEAWETYECVTNIPLEWTSEMANVCNLFTILWHRRRQWTARISNMYLTVCAEWLWEWKLLISLKWWYHWHVISSYCCRCRCRWLVISFISIYLWDDRMCQNEICELVARHRHTGLLSILYCFCRIEIGHINLKYSECDFHFNSKLFCISNSFIHSFIHSFARCSSGGRDDNVVTSNETFSHSHGRELDMRNWIEHWSDDTAIVFGFCEQIRHQRRERVVVQAAHIRLSMQ